MGAQTQVTPVALDHNFPETILQHLTPWMPEVEVWWVREIANRLEEIDPDYPHLPELDDHDLIYEVRRVGFPIMVTGNYKMQNDGRVLAAVEETRLTLMTIQGAGHDLILTTGVLLRDLVPIIKADVYQGLIYPARSSRITPRRPQQLAERQDNDLDDLVAEHSRAFAQRKPYPPEDPRRLV